MHFNEREQLDALLRTYAVEHENDPELQEAAQTLLKKLEASQSPAEQADRQVTGGFSVLRLSEAERLSLLRGISDFPEISFWFYVHSKDQVFWSESLYEQLGFSQSNTPLTFEEFVALVHSESRQEFVETYQEHLATGEPMNMVGSMVTNNGEQRHLRSLGFTTYDDAGRPVCSYGAVLDVTRLMAIEKQLDETELRARHLFESMNTGVVYHQADGSIYLANPAAAAILGLSVDQLLGRDSMDPRWHAIRSDGSPFPGEEHPAMQALKTGRSVHNVEMGIYHPEKDAYVWILTSAEPQFHSGEDTPYEVFTTFSDITGQRQMNEELQRRGQMQQLLVELALQFINIPPEKLDRAINESMKKLGQFVQADRVYIFEYDFPNMECSNTHEWCAEGISPEIHNLQRSSIRDIPHWWQKHKKGEPLYIKDVFALDRNDGVRQILEPQGIKSLLTMPITMPDNSCWGFIGFDSVENHHTYSDEEINILKVFMRLIAGVRSQMIQLEQISQSEKLLNSLLLNNPVITATKDKEGRYLRVNPAWEAATGIPEEATLGKTDAELFEERTARQFMGNDAEVLQNGEIITSEEFLKEGKHTRYFDIIKFPLYGTDDSVTGLGAMINEVTELRKNRETLKQFSNIIEQSPSEVYTIRASDLRIERMNPAAFRKLGYSRSEAEQLYAFDIKPDMDEADFRKWLKPLADGTSETINFETLHQTKSGNTYPVEVHLQRIVTDGEMSFVATAYDISERRKRAKTIAAQNKTLREITWQQSHEVRAPLARLLGLVQALEDADDFPVLQDPAQKELQELLRHIYNTAVELDSIVASINQKASNVKA